MCALEKMYYFCSLEVNENFFNGVVCFLRYRIIRNSRYTISLIVGECYSIFVLNRGTFRMRSERPTEGNLDGELIQDDISDVLADCPIPSSRFHFVIPFQVVLTSACPKPDG